MKRKLASIQKIDSVIKHPHADTLNICKIQGWNVVTKCNEFKEGDLCIYFQIDSFLPIRPEFEFLRKMCYRKIVDQEGFRIKTVRLRGQVSQGLLMPASILHGWSMTELMKHEGMDVTDILGVTLYEKPIPTELEGKSIGGIPANIQKTDEERIQNLVLQYEELKQDKYYVTEKLEGVSSTFFILNNRFGVCQKNYEMVETSDNILWQVARALDIENKLRSLGRNIAIQGELIGEGIKGNPYRLRGKTVKFFTAFDPDTYERLSFDKFVDLFVTLGLEVVPILGSHVKLPDTVDDLLKMADGGSMLASNVPREGLVFRSLSKRTSFKVISNKYLLSEKD